VDDFPSIHLTFEYKSSPIDQAAVNKMKSHKSDVFRQLFDTQIERLKAPVWWGSPARGSFDSLENGSHAFSNFAGESIRLMLGGAGWKIVAVLLKLARKAGQSRLSKAVKNADKASSTEAAFEFNTDFSCVIADSVPAVINANRPTTKYFFLSIPGAPANQREYIPDGWNNGLGPKPMESA
jgi:hypothetical protein